MTQLMHALPLYAHACMWHVACGLWNVLRVYRLSG